MLPIDIIIKIAFVIPDATDLFAFLEAFRPYLALGPLEHLVQLSLTHKYSDFWPWLRLSSSLGELSMPLIAPIAKFYANVLVDDTWHDVEWLKAYLSPVAKIEWCVNGFPTTIDRIDAWTDLPISSLKLTVSSDSPANWKDVLFRLHNLTCLHLDADCDDLGDIFDFVAKSERITEFKIYSYGAHHTTERDLENLIEWFRRQPVRVFDAELLAWGHHDLSLRQQFCEAMFNCSTLDSLRLLEHSNFEGINFSRLTFPMKTLRLHNETVTADALRSLSGQLEGSKLTHLEVMDCIEGAESLFRILPRTCIKSLNFHGFYIDDDGWCTLTPLFENCGLESLLLGTQHFSKNVIESLAAVMQRNTTISELFLVSETLDSSSFQVLIDSFSHPSRLVTKRRLKIVTLPLGMMESSTIVSFAVVAAANDCDFEHSRLQPSSLSSFDFRIS
ncbi:hypothetical protein LEN26_012937 [Aphanomyces euteiches]|nr:hypothetical protein LEN26_012937 [Aphanomyces euteiches]